MKQRPRIYVAGPITLGDRTTNLRRAEDAGIALIRAGFSPFVPHMDIYLQRRARDLRSFDLDTWLEIDLCDGVLRIPGESRGADREVRCARRRGLPVFRSVERRLRTSSAARRVTRARCG